MQIFKSLINRLWDKSKLIFAHDTLYMIFTVNLVELNQMAFQAILLYCSCSNGVFRVLPEQYWVPTKTSQSFFIYYFG